MCTTILPLALSFENLDSNIVQLTYVFNRWLRILSDYEKIDSNILTTEFSLISQVLISPDIPGHIKYEIRLCRDYALKLPDNKVIFVEALMHALSQMKTFLEDPELLKIKQLYADQGMTIRYKYLSKKLRNEKIKRLGKKLVYINSDTDPSTHSKLKRRIIEKRAAQTVHKHRKGRSHWDNQYRYDVRRAISFNLYNSSFIEYDVKKRNKGTHWKVTTRKHSDQPILKAKQSYKTYEDASEACIKYLSTYPNDTRPISPYKCKTCGNWHIGHERIPSE